MKNTTWVFGSVLAAGCMLLSVPASAQGGFPQGGFPQGNFPQQGAGRNPAAAQTGAKAGTAKTNTTTKSATAKNDKAALEAAKYQLSNHRTDLIRSTIDGHASSEDLSDPAVMRSIMNEIEKKMPLIPNVPLEVADPQELNEKAKKAVEQEYGDDDKKYASVVEAEAAAEFPLYKVGDKVVVNYNMGPKYFSVKGTLYRVTENAITVEDKVINLIDLNDETRSRFDTQKNKYMRDRYIETHIHLLNRLKLEKRQDYYDKFRSEIFNRNETAGYIYDPQTDHWATAQEIAKNYSDRIIKDKARQQRTKPATTTPATTKTEPVTPATNVGGGQTATPTQRTETGAAQPGKTTLKAAASLNEAIGITDTPENRTKYKAVLEKAEKQQEDAYNKYSGIDTDSGYKNACWGFSIADARLALWQEPEFPYIVPGPGHDTIKIPSEGLDVGLIGDVSSIELVYDFNKLSKVVLTMKDCSRQDFTRFKDALSEKYGRAVEDKGQNSAAFSNIFSGKTKPQAIADPAEIAAAQAAVKEAEKEFNRINADLKKAKGDERTELQEKHDQAVAVLKEATAKAEKFENAISADDLPYVYSLITLDRNSEGAPLLPFTFTWKGKAVSGTLIFYYDKTRDKVTNLIFAKERVE